MKTNILLSVFICVSLFGKSFEQISPLLSFLLSQSTQNQLNPLIKFYQCNPLLSPCFNGGTCYPTGFGGLVGDFLGGPGGYFCNCLSISVCMDHYLLLCRLLLSSYHHFYFYNYNFGKNIIQEEGKKSSQYV